MYIVFVLIASVGFVVSGKNQPQGQEDTSTRYLIKSDNGMLKAMYGVRHNFDSGFTTDLSPGQLKVLEKFGVEVEEVQIYSITARPTCNFNDICEPGLGENPSCTDCKSEIVDPEPEPTECFPINEMPWGIEKVNGGVGGERIVVAVLDTGVDQDHPDLVGNIIDCVAFGYRTCEDGNGHGTHVAGTILANGNIIGVAPQAELIAIKVLKDNGRGYVDDIAAGIYYAADNGANIISMSLGGGESSLINDAVDYATEKGVLAIASAGNSGPAKGSILYPAANPNVVAVAAFDINNAIPYWSSRGINNDDWVIEVREIEFAAPGVAIESTLNDGCYGIKSGTSMAAPHVAGIAARDWTGTADGTRTYMQGLAEVGYDYGQLGDDIEAGFGLPIVLPIE